jgi:predicted CxxxxCH...CXXCH cytochrome family protein
MQQPRRTQRPASRVRAAGAPALELVHSSEYLPPKLTPSLAACIRADIAVLTRAMATGDIKQRPHVCLARPAEGTGAVVQVPLHWRLLAGRLGQQSRPHGRPGAGIFLSLHSGSSCLTDASTRPVGGSGDTNLHCHSSGTGGNRSATWTGGMVIIAATGVRRPGSAPLSRMTRGTHASRAVHRYRREKAKR